MSTDDKRTFWTEKNKLRKSGSVFHRKEQASQYNNLKIPVNNMRTSNKENQQIPAMMIGGFEVNKSGDMDSEFWKQMSTDDKRMFWTAKNKLRKAGVVFHRKEHTSQHIKSKIAMTVPQWGVHTKYTSSWEVIGNYNIKVKSKDSQKVARSEIRQRYHILHR